jgi:hypothetical protein
MELKRMGGGGGGAQPLLFSESLHKRQPGSLFGFKTNFRRTPEQAPHGF